MMTKIALIMWVIGVGPCFMADYSTYRDCYNGGHEFLMNSKFYSDFACDGAGAAVPQLPQCRY